MKTNHPPLSIHPPDKCASPSSVSVPPYHCLFPQLVIPGVSILIYMLQKAKLIDLISRLRQTSVYTPPLVSVPLSVSVPLFGQLSQAFQVEYIYALKVDLPNQTIKNSPSLGVCTPPQYLFPFQRSQLFHVELRCCKKHS